MVLLPVVHAFLKGREWILQQDINPTHMKASERAVKDWNAYLRKGHIHEGKVQIMKDWPPNPPGNTTDICWAITKGRVLKMMCNIFHEFSEVVKDIFANLCPTPLYTIIAERIKQCTQVKGARTHDKGCVNLGHMAPPLYHGVCVFRC